MNEISKTAIFTSTNDVYVNGIKITSSEDWKKVLKSLMELQQENEKLTMLLKEYETKDYEEANIRADILLELQPKIDKLEEIISKAVEYINSQMQPYNDGGIVV